MTWAPLLLAERSPCLRRLVLQELMGKSDDHPEVLELRELMEEEPRVASLLKSQAKDGSWGEDDLGGDHSRNRVRASSFVLQRLSYLGLRNDHPAILSGVEYIFSKQRKDGAWAVPRSFDGVSLDGGVYTVISLQTSIPLLGIAATGHAVDERAESAYEWLIGQRLEDGSWPTGMVGNVYGYQAGYRRMPHSQWGCRTNTTLALSCLAYHPTRRTSEEARKAFDLLLARETRDRNNVGFNAARIVGFEPHRGYFTYHARFDPALVLDLCWRIGADRNDNRVDDLVNWFVELQGPYGLWEYGPRPEASRWITFDILRSLTRLDDSTTWFGEEPRTPFRAYPRKKKRF